jgi:hypothetical protein
MRARGYVLNSGELDVPRLAGVVKCTRAVLHKYLKGQSKQIEALLLFDLCDALEISSRWLLTDSGTMARAKTLTPDQARVLNIYALLDENKRGTWVDQGEDFLNRQAARQPSREDPFALTRRVVDSERSLIGPTQARRKFTK